MASNSLLSVVVPVFNEAEGIGYFHERATAALEAIAGVNFELVYVDDGSRDGSYEIMRDMAKDDPRARIIKLSRNFGHQIAITAGLDYARGDAIVFIDADLQDPPEVIAELVAKWREGHDVVYARRAKRPGETAFKLFTASMFYRLLRSVTNIDIPPDVGDFRLISKRVADVLRGMKEKDRFIRGLVSWVGFKQASVLYNRDERYAGVTKYPLRKMIKFALDGITSFSSAPLRIATWLGNLVSGFAFLYLAVIIWQALTGQTVPGFASIMVAVLFIGGVQLICLGILGEYLGRVFNEVKPRPVYIVEETVEAAEAVGVETQKVAALAGAAARETR